MSNVSIPIYDVIIDDNSLGLAAVSFVSEPAISVDFVAMEKEKLENMIWFSKHYKHEIVSPILIPNQLILRQAKDGNLYYIRWTEEAIANAAAKFLANGFFHRVTLNHPMLYDESLTYDDVLEDDVYMQRLWIVQDEKNDDAHKLYGFTVPKGTLMIKYKVYNKALWQKIVDGEVKGLSVEAFCNVVRNNNSNVNLNMQKLDVTSKQMNMFQKFIQFMNEVSEEAKEISDIAKNDDTNSGEVSLKYFIDDEHWIEVDAEGYARDTEYNLVAEGEYLLADGSVIVIDANNKFVETKVGEKTEDNVPVEAPIAEEKLKDEEKDEKDDEEPKAEGDGEVDTPNGEGDAPSAEEDAEVGDEEDDEKKRVASAEIDNEEPKEDVEVPAEEPTEEVPSTLVPFDIDGVEYQLPQEVVDFINSLIAAKDATMSELSLMKERMPSASPIPTVIAQASDNSSESTFGLTDAIRLLNYKR